MLVLLGPTGTGKTETAVDVASRIDGEIVGCDAVQLYRGLDCATAKPTPEQRRRVPHHLIDRVDPVCDVVLADYVLAAEQAIAEIANRGRVPIVVGGSGLYLRGLLRGVIAAPQRNEELRERLRAMARRFGTARLHRWLTRLDPPTAGRLSTGDRQRIVRALEIALSEGPNWSERLARDGNWSADTERYPALKLGLDLEQRALDPRLARRVNTFFERGLIAEIAGLLASGVPPEANAFKAIGYREVLDSREGLRDSPALRERVLRNTRRLVKRQRTWFRRESGVQWLDAATGSRRLADRIVELWRAEQD